jgi:hypothetical protein
VNRLAFRREVLDFARAAETLMSLVLMDRNLRQHGGLSVTLGTHEDSFGKQCDNSKHAGSLSVSTRCGALSPFSTLVHEKGHINGLRNCCET